MLGFQGGVLCDSGVLQIYCCASDNNNQLFDVTGSKDRTSSRKGITFVTFVLIVTLFCSLTCIRTFFCNYHALYNNIFFSAVAIMTCT